MLQSNGGGFSGTFGRRGIIRGGERPHVHLWQIFVGFAVRGSFQYGGTGSAGARSAGDFSVSGSDGAGARRRAPADSDSDAHECDEAAADFIPANTLWRAGESAAADACVNERAGAGRVHFRGAESARALQV